MWPRAATSHLVPRLQECGRVRQAALMFLVVTACTTGGGKRPIEQVAIEGNKAYGDSAIVTHLQTQPPHGWLVHTREEFDPVALQIDRKRVEAFYHEHGFFDAKVTDVNVDHKPDGGVAITITVQEGPPTQIAQVQYEGMQRDFVDHTLASNDIHLSQGGRFLHPDYLLAKDALQKELVKKGYAHAEVNGVVEVNRDRKEAVVRLDADPGPLVHFGKVKVDGLKTLPESTVLNRVAWNEGEQFDPALLESTEGKLYQLGVFSAVKADYDHDDRPPIVDVTVHVTEGTRHELRLGAGVGVDIYRFDVHQKSEYTIHELLGPLTTLKLSVVPGWSWLRTSPYSSGPSVETQASLAKDDFLFANL